MQGGLELKLFDWLHPEVGPSFPAFRGTTHCVMVCRAMVDKWVCTRSRGSFGLKTAVLHLCIRDLIPFVCNFAIRARVADALMNRRSKHVMRSITLSLAPYPEPSPDEFVSSALRLPGHNSGPVVADGDDMALAELRCRVNEFAHGRKRILKVAMMA